jgi:hypothetical protein
MPELRCLKSKRGRYSIVPFLYKRIEYILFCVMKIKILGLVAGLPVHGQIQSHLLQPYFRVVFYGCSSCFRGDLICPAGQATICRK